MADKLLFEYDMNADFDNLLNQVSQPKQNQAPMQSKMSAQKNQMSAQPSKMMPQQMGNQMVKTSALKSDAVMDVPEPQFIQQQDITINVPIADPDREHLQVNKDDNMLQHFENDIKMRVRECRKWLQTFKDAEGGLLNVGRSYKKYGLNLLPNGDITFKEWAPSAKSLSIFGEFNNWNREEFRVGKDDFGCFNITLPAVNGKPRIPHNTKYKINIEGPNGERKDRNSAWTRMAVQDPQTFLYDCFWWNPEQKFQWTHKRPVPQPEQSVRIYEAHVGMAQEWGKVNLYKDFADYNLDRIKKAGYNVIQLMAIQEHSYYASFGYHVTNFFGISSRSGNPDEFKYLVNKAHSLGLRIVIDLVHSHASTNENDGIKNFDGTDHCFSHGGERGYHSGWDSMLFDYSKYEVKRFLLSNLAWFMDEYNVDGFRFDAVTSILYNHHGIGVGFSGDYKEYFGMQVDQDGVTYLMLANVLIREINQNAITIAEDVSGMPTLCRTLKDGGLGFDYRLSMFMPDMWIKLLKSGDEYWSMGHIVHSITNRRWKEKVIGYAESHDQAIVGDKTISMQLFEEMIYTHMSKQTECNDRISRGMALHKMIRLISQSLGGEGYLNFMGNEFGHPEWIDFPREGNGNSFQHCRRQWNLMYDKDLRYGDLYRFDEKMNQVEINFQSMLKQHQYVSTQDDMGKVIVYEKGDLLYIFNFHPTQSYQDFPIGTLWQSDHFILFESDEERFGGHRRLDGAHNLWFEVYPYEHNKRPNHFKFYLPCRTCVVMCAYENAIKYLNKNPNPIDRMPQPTDRQKQQVAKLQQATKLQDSHIEEITKMKNKLEESKNNQFPQKSTIVYNKKEPQQYNQPKMGGNNQKFADIDDDDITQQLLKDVDDAQNVFNKQKDDMKGKQANNMQIKKQRDQKFIDLMDDLDI